MRRAAIGEADADGSWINRSSRAQHLGGRAASWDTQTKRQRTVSKS